MNHIFFLSGSISPKTGGEYYNFKLYERLKAEGLAPVYIDLHAKRYLFKLSWIPLVGPAIINLVMAMLLIYRCSGLVVEDHYFIRHLVFFNFIQKTFRREEGIITILHHLDDYSSQEDSQKDSQEYKRLKKTFVKIREQIYLHWTDVIVTNSDFTKSEINSLDIKKTVLVLPPALEREKLKVDENLEKSHSDINIMCVGHCIPRKGIVYLVEGFSKVERPGVKLHIVGKLDKDRKYYQQVRNLIDRLGLKDSVVLHGRLNQSALNQLYLLSDIFVLPSLKEGFGIVLLEAMYFGLPILTTNISAMPELVQNGENGLLFPPGNSQCLAEALSKLISDPALRKVMGTRGRERMSKSYYWEQTSSEFLQIVQQMDDLKNDGIRASAR